VEAARTEATTIIQSDPNLLKYPEMKKILDVKKLEIHFE
jgi:hypothetical protein